MGFIPCAQLIYCRELTDLIQHGLAISTWLTMRGFPLMLIDASAPIEGLVGCYVDGKSSKYFKGPRPVKAIDHTYSEMVLLGFQSGATFLRIVIPLLPLIAATTGTSECQYRKWPGAIHRLVGDNEWPLPAATGGDQRSL